MTTTETEVISFVQENDVKFIRLAFCDHFGVQKNISIMPSELGKAFSHGIPFDASMLNYQVASDLFLKPDPLTLTILPWRPQQGRVVRFFCNVFNQDKTPFLQDSRSILNAAQKKCAERGLSIQIGTKCEFYLFKTDENQSVSFQPIDNGGYCDIAPLDKAENVRREICLALEQMGIQPESSHHEKGPGQNEIDFKANSVVTAADNFINFKSVVKAIAAQHGYFASFMPKPLFDNYGSGLHISLSVSENDKPLDCSRLNSFVAGIMARVREMSFFLNPLSNSYNRFGEHKAPQDITWSKENHSQLIYIPEREDGIFEIRSPDCTINPYLSFALIVHAGLLGLENTEQLPPEMTAISVDEGEKSLPVSLKEAVSIVEKSTFVKSIIGESLLSQLCALKQNDLIKNNERDLFLRDFTIM
ncbi:MAG: glutamine synthetase family protein [Treponemataceae bacterium]